MNNTYKISVLRIFDQDDSLKVHSPQEYCKVKYNGDYYQLTENSEYYQKRVKGKHRYINIVIDGDINQIIKSILIRLNKEKINPMETALLYEEIFEFSDISQAFLSDRISKTQGSISNKIRLLNLPIHVQKALLQEDIKERHGRALLMLNSHPDYSELTKKLTNEVIDQELRVVDLENKIYTILGKPIKQDIKTKVTKLETKRSVKNREVILSINQLEKDLNKSIEVIKSYLPNIEIEKTEGLSGDDYIINLCLKDVNKEK